MPNFSTFGARIDYNIVHGKVNPIHWNAYNLPKDIGGAYFYNIGLEGINEVQYRHIVLQCKFIRSGGKVPSGITISLYKPKSHYIDDNGVTQPLDIWGKWPIDDYAIPPPGADGTTPNPELRRDTSYSDYGLVKWMNRYWVAVSGTHDVISDPSAMVPPETGWPGLRHAHTVHPRELLGISMTGGDGVEFASVQLLDEQGILLRVSAKIESTAERFLVLVTVYRGDRNIKYICPFSVQGTMIVSTLVEAEYIPIAIVYSPPGQDMTNTLIESESHGTRITFGESIASGDTSINDIVSGYSASFVNLLGIKVKTIDGYSEGQSVTDASSFTYEITKTQETMITANNQMAIGRAYWGPLGDLFVIIKDFLCVGTQLFDEEYGYALIPIQESPRARKLILATHELLRPRSNSIANEIEWEDRKAILRLNPFIVKDDSILDAVNAGTKDLHEAINPDANPNTLDHPTRAIKVLNLELGRGAELNFYQSKGITLNRVVSHAITYTASFKEVTDYSFYQNIPIFGGMLGIEGGETFTGEHDIHYQLTREASETIHETQTAKCYLIRNQNDPSKEIIDVYYDTIFGTFLFRTIPEETTFEVTIISGVITDVYATGWDNIPVYVLAGDDSIITSDFTNDLGFYRILSSKHDILGAGPSPPELKLVVGDKTISLNLTEKEIESGTVIRNIKGVRKIFDISRARYFDVMEAFDVSIEKTHTLSKKINQIKSKDDVYKLLGISTKRQKTLDELYKFTGFQLLKTPKSIFRSTKKAPSVFEFIEKRKERIDRERKPAKEGNKTQSSDREGRKGGVKSAEEFSFSEDDET